MSFCCPTLPETSPLLNYFIIKCFFMNCTQSRSSEYAEYASSVGPLKHQDVLVPCSQIYFNFSFVFEFGQRLWKHERSFILMRCAITLSTKNLSNHVRWMSYSLLLENFFYKCMEPWKRWALSASTIRETNALHPFFHPNHTSSNVTRLFRNHFNILIYCSRNKASISIINYKYIYFY